MEKFIKKKQEFSSSKLFINPNIICTIDKDDFSEIYKSNICQFANRNFFFSTCITDSNKIKINLKNYFPINSAFQFNYGSDDSGDKLIFYFSDIMNKNCSNNLKNCSFELNLKEKFPDYNISNFYVKLIDKKYGYYLIDKYILKTDL